GRPGYPKPGPPGDPVTDASRRSAMVAARELERGVPWMRPFLQTADLYLRCRAEAIPLRTIPGRVGSRDGKERRGDRSDFRHPRSGEAGSAARARWIGFDRP